MHLHFGAIALAFEVGRERRDRLDLRQLALFGIVAEGGDGGCHLVDDIGVLAIGMEREMPRPRARRNSRKRRIVWRQRACRRIEAIDQNLV